MQCSEYSAVEQCWCNVVSTVQRSEYSAVEKWWCSVVCEYSGVVVVQCIEVKCFEF